MKAAQIDDYGDASVIQVRNVDRPELKPGQVLVEAYAASLNPFDTTIRSGLIKDTLPLNFPVTLGGDIAGVVAEVASDVSSVIPGDKVYGQANVVAGNSGALAEFAATSHKQIAKMPSNLDFTQSAAMPLVGVSAWQALTQHIKLTHGQTILIHGGSGGIGSQAIQIAKHIGARVITTATGDGIAYARKLGADEVIDYKSQDFTQLVKDCDAVFDTVGGDEFSKVLSGLKRGGIGVSMIAKADEAQVSELGVSAITQSTKVTSQALDALRDLIEPGAITPHVHKVFPLEQIQEAFSLRETGNIIGKVVIQIRQ